MPPCRYAASRTAGIINAEMTVALTVYPAYMPLQGILRGRRRRFTPNPNKLSHSRLQAVRRPFFRCRIPCRAAPPPASGIGVGRMGSALDGWVMHAPDAPPPNPNRTDACEAHPKLAIRGWRGDGNGGWNGKRARDREPAGIDSRQPRPPFPACFQVTHPKIFLSWLFSGSRCRVPVMSFTIVPPHSGIAVRIDTRTHAASATTDRSKRSLTAGFIPERT